MLLNLAERPVVLFDLSNNFLQLFGKHNITELTEYYGVHEVSNTEVWITNELLANGFVFLNTYYTNSELLSKSNLYFNKPPVKIETELTNLDNILTYETLVPIKVYGNRIAIDSDYPLVIQECYSDSRCILTRIFLLNNTIYNLLQVTKTKKPIATDFTLKYQDVDIEGIDKPFDCTTVRIYKPDFYNYRLLEDIALMYTMSNKNNVYLHEQIDHFNKKDFDFNGFFRPLGMRYVKNSNEVFLMNKEVPVKVYTYRNLSSLTIPFPRHLYKLNDYIYAEYDTDMVTKVHYLRDDVYISKIYPQSVFYTLTSDWKLRRSIIEEFDFMYDCRKTVVYKEETKEDYVARIVHMARDFKVRYSEARKASLCHSGISGFKEELQQYIQTDEFGEYIYLPYLYKVREFNTRYMSRLIKWVLYDYLNFPKYSEDSDIQYPDMPECRKEEILYTKQYIEEYTWRKGETTKIPSLESYIGDMVLKEAGESEYE